MASSLRMKSTVRPLARSASPSVGGVGGLAAKRLPALGYSRRQDGAGALALLLNHALCLKPSFWRARVELANAAAAVGVGFTAFGVPPAFAGGWGGLGYPWASRGADTSSRVAAFRSRPQVGRTCRRPPVVLERVIIKSRSCLSHFVTI